MRHKSKSEEEGRTGIRIDPAILQDVQRIAEIEDRSRNNMIQMILRKYVEMFRANHPGALQALDGHNDQQKTPP